MKVCGIIKYIVEKWEKLRYVLNNHIGISASRRRVFLAHVKPNAPVRKRRTRAAVAILKAKKRFVLSCLFAKKRMHYGGKC